MLSVTRVEYSTRKCKRVGIGAVRNPHAPLHFGSSDGERFGFILSIIYIMTLCCEVGLEQQG